MTSFDAGTNHTLLVQGSTAVAGLLIVLSGLYSRQGKDGFGRMDDRLFTKASSLSGSFSSPASWHTAAGHYVLGSERFL